MRIGVDLGGSKIEGLVLGPPGGSGVSPDVKTWSERARLRVATPAGDYAATVAAVAALVAALAKDSGCGPDAPVGVGIPGAISLKTGLIKNANSTCLIGRPFDRDLAAATGRRVRLANDADCFAVSEATDGAGAGVGVVFGVILGTGVGGGIAVDGRLLEGRNAIAGEWGHNPLPWPQRLPGAPPGPDGDERPGPPCYCGKLGCIETFVSGGGLERDFAAAAGGPGGASGVSPAKKSGASGVSPANIMASGRKMGAADIVAAADSGEASATAAMSRYCHRLARALASVINVLDPGVIVLGGGMSNARRLYDAVPRLLAPRSLGGGGWVFSDEVTTPLKPARHGDSSGVRGAAWLWEGPPACQP